MKYTTLGQSGISISCITHGCMELGGGRWKVMDELHNASLLKTAREHGITSFDTAEGYGAGSSERIVGAALKGIRKDCVIATKVSPDHLHPADVRKSAEMSLKRLETDYIDLLYVHWPNDKIPLEDTLGEFTRLKEEGKIRAIGVSNFNLDLMQKAVSLAQIDALQPEYNLLQRDIENGVFKFCNENQVSILSYNSIAKGILSGAFHFGGAVLDSEDFRNEKPLFSQQNQKEERPLLELLKEVAQEHRVSISQISAAWVLKQVGVSSAIIGTQNLEHFIDNIGASEVELSVRELERLNEMSSSVIAKLK